MVSNKASEKTECGWSRGTSGHVPSVSHKTLKEGEEREEETDQRAAAHMRHKKSNI